MKNMKWVVFLILFLGSAIACKQRAKQPETIVEPAKFDKTKWATKNDADYPYRKDMLNDVIINHVLKGVPKAEVISMLGQPDRIDSAYLFYRIAQKRIGVLPISTKTFVIKLAPDSTVEWRKVHG